MGGNKGTSGPVTLRRLQSLTDSHCRFGTSASVSRSYGMSSTRPYDEILNDWNDRLKAEPEWVQFEAEIMIQCSAQDGTPEEILVLAFIMQARASVLQGSMDKALELYNCALTRANNITFPQLPESLVWMQEAQEEYEDLWKLGQSLSKPSRLNLIIYGSAPT